MRGSLFIKKVLRDNRGATAIEYGLIIALIVIAIIVAVQSVATETTGMWAFVRERVTNPGG
jgi:pilus assembly protein Flp/PilA